MNYRMLSVEDMPLRNLQEPSQDTEDAEPLEPTITDMGNSQNNLDGLRAVFNPAWHTAKAYFEKAKVYINSPNLAPKGAQVQQGPRGGYFYEENETEKLKWEPSIRHGHKEWNVSYGKNDFRIEQNTNGYTLHTHTSGTFNWRRSIMARTLAECKVKAERMIYLIRQHESESLEKAKKYIAEPTMAPAGVQVEQGPRGGWYYESEGKQGFEVEEEPQEIPLEDNIENSQKAVKIWSGMPEWSKDQSRIWQGRSGMHPQTNRVYSTDEVDAMFAYTLKTQYAEINGSLRQGKVNANVASWIKGLDSAISKVFLPTSVLLFRGAQVKDIGNLEVGDVFQDKGFVSTSLDPNTAWEFTPADAGSVLIGIQTPQGTNVCKGQAGYRELILKRGLHFQVISKQTYYHYGRNEEAPMITVRILDE